MNTMYLDCGCSGGLFDGSFEVMHPCHAHGGPRVQPKCAWCGRPMEAVSEAHAATYEEFKDEWFCDDECGDKALEAGMVTLIPIEETGNDVDRIAQSFGMCGAISLEGLTCMEPMDHAGPHRVEGPGGMDLGNFYND